MKPLNILGLTIFSAGLLVLIGFGLWNGGKINKINFPNGPSLMA